MNKLNIKKIVGVLFDDRLEWSNYITYRNSKISKGVGIICRAKKYFNTSALINLYNAFVFPYFIYCVEIWGNALSIHIHSLIKLQNKIVRMITSSYHTAQQLYTNTGRLPFKILVTHRIGLLMHKLSHGNVPKPIQNVYKSNNNVHTHYTRHAHYFHTMRGHNELIYRTFAFQSVLIWNKLLQNITIHVSYTRFKHLLKKLCYPMLLPLDMTNSGVLLLVFLLILCPPHPLHFPFLLSQMTFYYLSFYINYIIDTFLHNIVLQLLCYILLDILF